MQSIDFKYAENLFFRDEKEEALCGGGYGRYRKARRFDVRDLGYSLPDARYLNDARGWLQYSDFDMKQYMNSCINTKTDRASMRSSLELRSPLMDYRLAEYSRLLPYEYLYSKEMGGKRILKDILYEMVPREILERPKQGFAAPVGQWFKHELRETFMDRVAYSNISRLTPELDAKQMISYRDNFLQGKNPTLPHTSFFKLYSYIDWYNNKVGNMSRRTLAFSL